MKLSSALLAVFDFTVLAWEQPRYSDVLSAWASRSNVDWGAPLNGRARKWSDCPEIDISGKPGVAGLKSVMSYSTKTNRTKLYSDVTRLHAH